MDTREEGKIHWSTMVKNLLTLIVRSNSALLTDAFSSQLRAQGGAAKRGR
jgi:hypothetical protein